MTHFLSFTWNFNDGINLGFYTLHFYSLMFVIAFGLGWYIMKKIYDREGESVEKLDKLFIASIIATMLGARLGHVFFYDWHYYKDHLSEIILPFRFEPEFEFTGFTGLASHGAAIAVIFTVIWYSKKIIHRPVLWMLDRVVIPVTSGGVLVRVGNFFNSEILGSETSPEVFTAVRFVRDSDTISPNAAMKITESQDPDTAYNLIANNPQYADILNGIPFRHPAQLYEAFGYIFVFLILFYMYWKTDSRKHHGLIFGVFLVLLWSVRFVVEFVKQSQGGFEGEQPILSTGQWLSIPFILVGLYYIFTARKRTETL